MQALSAVCTHMGCIVRFNADHGSLDCPCHGASFALDGSPINHDYLQALPRLQSRVNGDIVEVRVNQA
jgi:Rieske Fe-S protein